MTWIIMASVRASRVNRVSGTIYGCQGRSSVSRPAMRGDRARDEKAYAVRTPLVQSPAICVTPASGPIFPDNPVLSVRIDMGSSTGRASPVGTSVARSISDAHCHEGSRGSSGSSMTVVWVFMLYVSVATAGSNGHARRFEADGQLVYPTREACQAARGAIRRLDPKTDHYVLEDCVPREARPS